MFPSRALRMVPWPWSSVFERFYRTVLFRFAELRILVLKVRC